MTNEEFSNEFDTLISAYSHGAEFGNSTSYADVNIDEYEKSVFLTQALNSIIKSYFDKNLNVQAQGFDDTIKRLMDFSNLVVSKAIDITDTTKGKGYSEDGYILPFPDSLFDIDGFSARPLYILNERVTTSDGKTEETPEIPALDGEADWIEDVEDELIVKIKNITDKTLIINISSVLPTGQDDTDRFGHITVTDSTDSTTLDIEITDPEWLSTDAKPRVKDLASSINTHSDLSKYILVADISSEGEDFYYSTIRDLTLTLKGKQAAIPAVYKTNASYVIVPIHYRNYDRIMSRPYSQPMKRQAWRLFENDGSTLAKEVELIFRADADIPKLYILRYIRKPRPIILIDLTKTEDKLSVEGYQKKVECELDSTIHDEILSTAVQLALGAKGIETKEMKAAKQYLQNNQ